MIVHLPSAPSATCMADEHVDVPVDADRIWRGRLAGSCVLVGDGLLSDDECLRISRSCSKSSASAQIISHSFRGVKTCGSSERSTAGADFDVSSAAEVRGNVIGGDERDTSSTAASTDDV